MLLEGINFKIFKYKIDDNITIPLIAGTVIWLMRLV